MLKGKVAVVSGSAQGLGKSFTQILLENGAQVTCRNTRLATERPGQTGMFI